MAMAKEETAIFGGGCFWCIEAVFQRLRGVKEAVSGYMGGQVENPTYRQVCNGDTGHVEVVRVKFDPNEIAYRDLLEVFLPFTIRPRSTGKAMMWASSTGRLSSTPQSSKSRRPRTRLRR